MKKYFLLGMLSVCVSVSPLYAMEPDKNENEKVSLTHKKQDEEKKNNELISNNSSKKDVVVEFVLGGHKIPQELIIEILEYTDLKSLVTFGCVSKNFHNLLHKSNENNVKFLWQGFLESPQEYKVAELYADKLDPKGDLIISRLYLKKELPFAIKNIQQNGRTKVSVLHFNLKSEKDGMKTYEIKACKLTHIPLLDCHITTGFSDYTGYIPEESMLMGKMGEPFFLVNTHPIQDTTGGAQMRVKVLPFSLVTLNDNLVAKQEKSAFKNQSERKWKFLDWEKKENKLEEKPSQEEEGKPFKDEEGKPSGGSS